MDEIVLDELTGAAKDEVKLERLPKTAADIVCGLAVETEPLLPELRMIKEPDCRSRLDDVGPTPVLLTTVDAPGRLTLLEMVNSDTMAVSDSAIVDCTPKSVGNDVVNVSESLPLRGAPLMLMLPTRRERVVPVAVSVIGVPDRRIGVVAIEVDRSNPPVKVVTPVALESVDVSNDTIGPEGPMGGPDGEEESIVEY